jgi:hypothetical protein
MSDDTLPEKRTTSPHFLRAKRAKMTLKCIDLSSYKILYKKNAYTDKVQAFFLLKIDH